ncbi:hypothetical protein Q3G72_034174 [Acer saccharum]|nr:hypothetical protein Q3G72_034174 [Acer saccharum]
MLLTQDEGVKSFIANLTAQLTGSFLALLLIFGCLENVFDINRLCSGFDRIENATGEVLDRYWNFSIETDSEVVEGVS